MASILTELQVKYKSREIEKTTQETKTSITLQGSKELCEQWINENPPGTIHSEYGTLEQCKLVQDEGPFWNVQVTYSIDRSGGSPTASHHNYGPKHTTLSMSMMSLPIESHWKYKCNWNNYLWATKSLDDMSSSQRSTAESIWENAGNYWNGIRYIIDDKIMGTGRDYNPATADLDTNVYFAWGKTESDCPTLQIQEGDTKHRWMKIYQMTKPGVESFSYPTYTLTEVSKNATKSKATWNLSDIAGTICDPKYGDFGLTDRLSGNWLLESAEISYDDRNWLTTRHYTHSPDVSRMGWDPDIYFDSRNHN